MKGRTMTCWGIEVQGFIIHDKRYNESFELDYPSYENYCKANRSRIEGECLWFSDEKLHAFFRV